MREMVERVRKQLSVESPMATAVVLVVVLGAVAAGAWLVQAHTWPGSVAVMVLAALGVLLLVSHFFSRRFLAVLTLLAVALVLAKTVRVGQEVTEADRLRRARAQLMAQMAERCRLEAAYLAKHAAGPGSPRSELATAGAWIAFAWPGTDPSASASLRCSVVAPELPAPRPAQLTDFSAPPDAHPPFAAHSSSPRTLALDTAAVELAVARAHLALASGPVATKSATAEVETATAALEAARNDVDAPPSPTSVVELLSAGGDRVVSALPAFDDRSVPVELTVAGWALVAGIVILFLRGLAIHAGRRGMGPVVVDAPADVADTLRTYLARNLPEPGTVPGAEAAKPVTDLLAAAGGAAAGWIDKLAAAVADVFDVPRGYTVKFTEIGKGGATTGQGGGAAGDEAAERSDEEWGAPPHAVGVVVSDTRTKRQIAQTVVFGKRGSDPWRTAAYWAAGIVLERSLDVPLWATWRPGANAALSTYFAAEDRGREGTLDELASALREAPDNGLLLMYGAGRYELADEPVISFLLTLRAVNAHPHYLVARYRLAIQASAVAVSLDRWMRADLATRQEICDLLRALPDRAGTGAARALGGEPGTSGWAGVLLDDRMARQELVRLGGARAVALQRGLSPWNLVLGMLRRRERRVTIALLRSDDQKLVLRSRMLDLARCVEVIAHIREGFYGAPAGDPSTADPAKRAAKRATKVEAAVIRRAELPSSGWQLAYNVACLYAVRAELADIEGRAAATDDHRDRAFEFMWRAMERSGSVKLTAEWLTLDPDLESIRKDRRFAELTRRTGGVA